MEDENLKNKPPKFEISGMSEDNTTKIHNDGWKEFYELRRTWSRHIINWIYGILIAQAIVAIVCFCEQKTEILAGSFLGATVAEIVGMGVICAKYLFSGQANQK